MSTAHERVRAEAEKRFPSWSRTYEAYPWETGVVTFGREDERHAFLMGRTVTAEQIEQAAEAYLGTIVWMDEGDWQNTDQQTQDAARAEARKVFAAAGLIVEEES